MPPTTITAWITCPRFYTYGGMPLSQHLEQIVRELLGRFEAAVPSEEVPLEPRWQEQVSECVCVCVHASVHISPSTLSREKSHICCPPDPMADLISRPQSACLSFSLSKSNCWRERERERERERGRGGGGKGDSNREGQPSARKRQATCDVLYCLSHRIWTAPKGWGLEILSC